MTRFQKLAVATVAMTLLLVTIGVIVRVTDSGMGCPDWPLCHGQLIPPLDDPNAWIEWVHRTVAALIGLLVLGLALVAFLDHRDRPSLLWPSFGAVALSLLTYLAAATETFGTLRKKYPDYSYKEATLNPTNPRNRAVEWETDVVNAFRDQTDLKEFSGERLTPTGPMLYLARPIQIKDPACLACHSVPAAAPPSMIKLYGENNGFGWKHQEIVGAQMVSVPMALPIKNADDAFNVFMGSLAAIFAVTFIVLNVMLSLMILRPITRMSAAADKISTGDFNVPEFGGGGKDEIGRLGTSFNRMRRSLAKALKLIER